MSKIMVVEDDPDIRELLHLQLELMEHDVMSAGSAAEVPGLMQDRGRPDAVILDIVMPGTDGLALLSALRRDPSYATLPVIVLTARTLGGDRAAVRDLHADYLVKPVDAGALSDAVTRALEPAAG